MTASTFDAALARVLAHEGGYSDDPRDPGGATNLGVTLGTLSGWLGRPATKAEVRALTPAAVAPIYRRAYWDRIRGDDLPAGIDYAAFDFAVNSGVTRAVMALQRALDVADDGRPGPLTLAAASREPAAGVVARLSAERLAFLRRLSTWPVFGRGWQRRVEEVRAAALALAASPVR
jgi:lysozyme family protein